MTLTNVSWLLDRDGEITITLPAGHVSPDDLALASQTVASLNAWRRRVGFGGSTRPPTA
jgi:hypothetical protein